MRRACACCDSTNQRANERTNQPTDRPTGQSGTEEADKATRRASDAERNRDALHAELSTLSEKLRKEAASTRQAREESKAHQRRAKQLEVITGVAIRRLVVVVVVVVSGRVVCAFARTRVDQQTPVNCLRHGCQVQLKTVDKSYRDARSEAVRHRKSAEQGGRQLVGAMAELGALVVSKMFCIFKSTVCCTHAWARVV